MVRETRYLWVGNLPEKASEERISEVFARHGKIQSVKLLAKDEGSKSAVVAFMDIRSASKAQNCENKLDSNLLQTQYSEPSAVSSGVTVTRTHVAASSSTPSSASAHDVVAAASSSNRTLFNQQSRPISSRYSGRSGGESGDDSRGSFDRSSSTRPKNEEKSHERSQKQRHPASATWTQGGVKQRLGGAQGSPARVDACRLQQKALSRAQRSSRSRSRSSSSSSSSQSDSRSRSHSRTNEGGKKLVKCAKGAEKDGLGLLIRRLPMRSTDSSLRDGLFHEYKKYGKVTSVSVIGSGTDRHAVVSFKKSEDACKAFEQSVGRVFFGSQIIVDRHEGFEVDDSEFQPPEAELDEYHHKATRTLFVGNLELDIDKQQLRSIFQKYGFIVDIDIKKQGNVSCYAFVQYDDIKSVVQALHDMDGEIIGTNKIKLGFGKSMPTNCVWLDGIAESVTEKFLARQFNRYGHVSQSVIDRDTSRGLVYFDSVEFAQRAVNEMRGRAIGGKKIQVDFASRDCQTLFFDNMERTGQIRPADRPDESSFNDAVSVTSLSASVTFEERFREERPGFERATPAQFSANYERAGWTNWSGGGSNSTRGSFRGSQRSFHGRGSASSSGPPSRSSSQDGKPFYEGGAFTQTGEGYNARERSRSRYTGATSPFNGGYEGDGYADSFEQALRDYGYTQRERREGSPRERRSRADGSPFPADHFEDCVSDRHRDTDSQSGERESVRSETRGRGGAHDEHYDGSKARALSPTSSEHSFRSKSPPSRYQRSKSPPLHYRRSHSSSPSSVKGHKLKDSQRYSSYSPEDYCRESRTHSPMEYTTFKHKDAKSKKDHEHYDSDSDSRRHHRASGKNNRLSRADSVDKRSWKARDMDSGASEEYFSQQKPENISDAQRQKRLQRQVSRSLSSGSRERSKAAESKHEDNDMGSTTSGSKTPMDSDQESFGEQTSSHSSGEVNQLEKEKVHLLSMLQQLDESGSSDGEDNKPHKKPRLDEVFDLERDPSMSMRKWREQAKMLVAAGEDTTELQQQLLAVPSSSADKHAATLMTDILQQSEMLKPLDRSKFKPIDASQSSRKQMEARRKKCIEERGLELLRKVKAKTEHKVRLEEGEEGSDVSPHDSGHKKRRVSGSHDKGKGRRSYRSSKHHENNHTGSSSEDDDYSSRKPRFSAPVPPSIEDKKHSRHERGRTDSVSSRSDSNRPLHALRDSRDSRGSMLEMRSDQPRIIPMDVLDCRGPDGKLDSKRIPQEPRTIPDNSKTDYPMSLPLPRFAKTAFQNMKAAEKAHQSPKPVLPFASSQNNSPLLAKISSPPFSPAIHSPAQRSPLTKNEDPPPSPPPPPPPPLPTTDVALAESVPVAVDPQASSQDEHIAPLQEELMEVSQPDAEMQKEPEKEDSDPPPPPPPPPPAESAATAKSDPVDSNLSPVKTSAKTDSESDNELISSPTSPGRPSLEERIRALDEKLSRTQNIKAKTSVAISVSTSAPCAVSCMETNSSTAPSTPSIQDYREKYRVRKRGESITSIASTGVDKTEPSAIVKSILSRSTIFDQDTRRLEQSGSSETNLDNSLRLHGILKKSPTPAAPCLTGSNEGMPSLANTRPPVEAYRTSGTNCSSDLMSAAGYPLVTPGMPTTYNFTYSGQRSPGYASNLPSAGLSPGSLGSTSRQSSLDSLPSTPGSAGGIRPCDPRRAAHDHIRTLASPSLSRNPNMVPNYPLPVPPSVAPVQDTSKLMLAVTEPFSVAAVVAPALSTPPILKKQDPGYVEASLLTVSPVKSPLADLTKSKEMNSPPIPILKKEGPDCNHDKKSQTKSNHGSSSSKRKASEAFGDTFLAKSDSLKTDKKSENGKSSSESGAVKTDVSKTEVKKERKHETSSSSSKSHNSKKHSSHSSGSKSKSGDKKSDSHGDKKSEDKSKHHDKKKSSSSKEKNSLEHKSDKSKKEHGDSDKSKPSTDKQSKSEKESKSKEKCEKSPKFDKSDKKDKDDKGKGRGTSNGKHSSSVSSVTKARTEEKTSGEKQQSKSHGEKTKSSESSSSKNETKQGKDSSKEKGKQEKTHDKTHSSSHSSSHTKDKSGSSGQKTSSSDKPSHKSRNDKSKERPTSDKPKVSSSVSSKTSVEKSSSSSSKFRPDSHHLKFSEKSSERKVDSKGEKSKLKVDKDDRSRSKDRKDKDKKDRSNEKKRFEDKEKACAARGRKKSESREENRELKMLAARWDGENESAEPYFSMYDMVKRRSNKERVKEESDKKMDDLKHKLDKLHKKRRNRLSTSFEADSSLSDMYEEDSEEGRIEVNKRIARRSSDQKPSAPKSSKRILNSSSDEDDIGSFAEVAEPKKPPTLPKKPAAPISRISDSSSDLSSSSDSDSDFGPKKVTKKPPPKLKPMPHTPAVSEQSKKKLYSIYTTSDSDSDVPAYKPEKKLSPISKKPSKPLNNRKSKPKLSGESNKKLHPSKVFSSSSSDSSSDTDDHRVSFSQKKVPANKMEDALELPKTKSTVKAKPQISRDRSEDEVKPMEVKKDSFIYTSSDDSFEDMRLACKMNNKNELPSKKSSEPPKKSKERPDREVLKKRKPSVHLTEKINAKPEKPSFSCPIKTEEPKFKGFKEETKWVEVPRCTQDRASIFELVEEQKKSPRMDFNLSEVDIDEEMAKLSGDFPKKEFDFDEESIISPRKSKDDSPAIRVSRSDNIFEKMELKDDPISSLMKDTRDIKAEVAKDSDSDSLGLSSSVPSTASIPCVTSETISIKAEELVTEDVTLPEDVKEDMRSDAESEVSQGLVIDETSNHVPDVPYVEEVPEVVVSESATQSESEQEEKPLDLLDDKKGENTEESGTKIGGQTEQSIELATDSLTKELDRDDKQSNLDNMSADFSSIEMNVEGLSNEETEEARDELNAAIENLIEKHLEPSLDDPEPLEIQTVEETVVPPEDALVEGSDQVVEIAEEVQIEQAPSVEVTCESQPTQGATAEVVSIQSPHTPSNPIESIKEPIVAHAEHERLLPTLPCQPDMSLVPDMYKGAPTEPQREPVVLRGEQLEEATFNEDKFDEYNFEGNDTPSKPARGRGRGRGGRGRGRRKTDEKSIEVTPGKSPKVVPSFEPLPTEVSTKLKESPPLKIADFIQKDPALALVDFVKDQQPMPFQLDGSRLSQSEYIANIENNIDHNHGHNDLQYLPDKVFPALEHEISKLEQQNRKKNNRARKAASPRPSGESDGFEEFKAQAPRTPTRGSPRQLDLSAPHTPPMANRRKSDGADVAEKYSSRGRKIIPKERDDEISSVNRKNRRPSAPKENEPETANTPKGRGRRSTSLPGPATELDPGKVKRGRKTPVKTVENKVFGLENLAPESEEVESMEESTDDKKGLRRKSQRKSKEEMDESNMEPAEMPVEEAHISVIAQEKPKKGRKPRAKKPSDLPSSPRRSESETASSPRTVSPKSSPVVKLEKLPLDHLMREETKKENHAEMAAKDLYAWEDDDEKPMPEYTHKRPLSRKRRSSEAETPSEPEVVQQPTPQPEPLVVPKAEVPVPPEPKKSKLIEVEPKEELPEPAAPAAAAAVPESVLAPSVTLPPKKDHLKLADVTDFSHLPSAAAPPQPEVAPELHRPAEHRHLPLKLEMKKEAAAKAKALAEACRQTEPLAPPLPTSTPDLSTLTEPAASPTPIVSKMVTEPHPCSWQSNMDKVIFDVANGNFERGVDFDYYTKMRDKSKHDETGFVAGPKSAHRKSTEMNSMVQPLLVNMAVVGPHAMHSPALNAKFGMSPRMKSPPAPVTPVTSTKTESPPAQAAPAPSLYPSQVLAGASTSESMAALQKVGYPLPAQQPPKHHQQQHLPPPAHQAECSRPVHIGVVPSQAYGMVNRESSPQGQQVIEKVPNPHQKEHTSSSSSLPASSVAAAYVKNMLPVSQAETCRPPSSSRSSVSHRASSPEVALVRPQPQQVAVAPQPHPHLLPSGPTKPDLRQPPAQMSPQLPKDLSPGLRQTSPHIPHMPPPGAQHLFPGGFAPSLAASQLSPPVCSQASELRAVLAQPSILIQQEQMLQQQQRLQQQQQQQQQSSQKQGHKQRGLPHQPPEHRQSPGVIGLGQHKMPYTFTEPRTAGMARAEPKTSQPSSGPHTQHPEAAIRPEMQPGFNHLPPDMKHEVRPGLPPQFYHPDMHLAFPGGLPMGVPRIPIDPRMMFPQHAEFLAHQGLGPILPGMVAPQPPPAALLAAQQGAATEHLSSERPSSRQRPSPRPTPPSAQPSPRTVTPHTPAILTAPAMQPPPPTTILRHAGMPEVTPAPSNDMAMLLQRYPVMWQGQLVLKNDCSSVQMHFVSGSKMLVSQSLPQLTPDGSIGPLRIAQRMRLETTQLDGVAKRMMNEQEFSMLLALPCGHDHMDIIHQSSCLRQGFITYLQQKQAAGIVNVPVPGSNQPGYVVHIFPPCNFSSENLSEAAPDLLHSVSEMAYLLVIIATVSS